MWLSDPQSREVSKGIERSKLLLDLGKIIVGHLETCETQLAQDDSIFKQYDTEVLLLLEKQHNDSLQLENKDIEIEGLTSEFKSQRRQKWGMTFLFAVMTYVALFK